jgi:hypothetical protein
MRKGREEEKVVIYFIFPSARRATDSGKGRSYQIIAPGTPVELKIFRFHHF